MSAKERQKKERKKVKKKKKCALKYLNCALSTIFSPFPMCLRAPKHNKIVFISLETSQQNETTKHSRKKEKKNKNRNRNESNLKRMCSTFGSRTAAASSSGSNNNRRHSDDAATFSFSHFISILCHAKNFRHFFVCVSMWVCLHFVSFCHIRRRWMRWMRKPAQHYHLHTANKII